jgi:hypothetical protein
LGFDWEIDGKQMFFVRKLGAIWLINEEKSILVPCPVLEWFGFF